MRPYSSLRRARTRRPSVLRVYPYIIVHMQFQLFIFNRCRTRGRRLWWLKGRSLHIQITFHSVASALIAVPAPTPAPRRRRLRLIRRRAGWIDARSTRLIVDALVRGVRMYGGKMALRSVDCGGGGRGRRPRRRHATDEKKRTDVQSSTRAQFSRRLAAPAPSLPARDMASSVKYFLLPTYGGTFESTFILFYLIRLHEPYWLARGLRPRRRGRRTTR